MRVLHVPHAYAPVVGGAETYVTRLSEELVRLGHEVFVFTTDFASPEGFYELGIARLGTTNRAAKRGVSVERFTYGKGSYEAFSRFARFFPVGSERLQRRLRRSWEQNFGDALEDYVAAIDPDVVLVLPHLWVSVRIALDRLVGVVPVVMAPLLHEHDPNWPFEDVRAALDRASGVVALTKHEVSRLSDAYRVSDDQLFYVGGGVDLPTMRELDRDPSLFVYLGRRSIKKGLDTLIAGFERAAALSRDLRLVIAGADAHDSHLVDDLVARLPDAARGRVRVMPDVTESKKSELLSTAACLVLPSTNESLGVVILEAWAHGAAVIAMDTPVMRSVIEHGVNGKLVVDEISLAHEMVDLSADPAGATKLGTMGKSTVVAKHDWRGVALRVEQAYRSVVSKGDSPT